MSERIKRLMGIEEMKKKEEIGGEEIATEIVRVGDEGKNIGEARLDKRKGKGKRFIEI